MLLSVTFCTRWMSAAGGGETDRTGGVDGRRLAVSDGHIVAVGRRRPPLRDAAEVVLDVWNSLSSYGTRDRR